MTLPALLANENVPAPTLRVLREAGVSVAWVAEFMPRASDRDVLAYAHTHALWVLTFDRDYGELVFARQVPAPPAILFVRQQPQPADALGHGILAVLRDTSFRATWSSWMDAGFADARCPHPRLENGMPAP